MDRPEVWTEEDERNLDEAMAAEHKHDKDHDRMFDFSGWPPDRYRWDVEW